MFNSNCSDTYIFNPELNFIAVNINKFCCLCWVRYMEHLKLKGVFGSL